MKKILTLLAVVLIASAFKMENDVSDPIPCIKEKCPNEWAVCEKDPSCPDLLKKCSEKCGTKETCWALCLGSHTDAVNVAKCAQKNGCVSQPNQQNCVKDQEKAEKALMLFTPQDCIKQYCPNQAQACGQDQNCLRTLQDCERQCQDNQTCWTNCIAQKGNPVASAFWKCVIDHNCLDQVQTVMKKTHHSTAIVAKFADIHSCLVQNCPDNWNECEKDKKCVEALHVCEKQCKQKQSCWALCLPKQGSDSANELTKCAVEHDCFNNQLKKTHPFIECMQKSCVSHQLECLYDKKCSKTVHKCMKKNNKFNFDLECLFKETKESEVINSWYQCAGNHFCL